MSRTLNTDPYVIQARARGGKVRHWCSDVPESLRFGRWDVACTAGDGYRPSVRYRCAAVTDVYGGCRAGQGAAATAAQRVERACLRSQLRAAVKWANGSVEGEDLWDIDVGARARSVDWELW